MKISQGLMKKKEVGQPTLNQEKQNVQFHYVSAN